MTKRISKNSKSSTRTFNTEKDVKDYFKELSEELVEHYCSEINSLEDLNRLGLFSLTELLKENATDEETIKAYKIKAKEFGFNLDNN